MNNSALHLKGSQSITDFRHERPEQNYFDNKEAHLITIDDTRATKGVRNLTLRQQTTTAETNSNSELQLTNLPSSASAVLMERITPSPRKKTPRDVYQDSKPEKMTKTDAVDQKLSSYNETLKKSITQNKLATKKTRQLSGKKRDDDLVGHFVMLSDHYHVKLD